MQRELRHHLPRQGLQSAHLEICQIARLPVDHAQRAEGMTIGRDERRARVKADVGVVQHQRIVMETGINSRIGHHEQAVGLQNGVRAKRVLTHGFARIEANYRLEPLAVAIDQAHHRNRRLADVRGEQGDVVVGLFGQAVEQTGALQRFQSRDFVGGQRSFHGRLRFKTAPNQGIEI